MKKIVIVLVVLFLSGCSQKTAEESNRYRESRMLMGTSVHLDICLDAHREQTIQQAYVQAWKRLDDISWRMNVYDEKSDIAKINNAYPEAAAVQSDTYQLIKDSIAFSRVSSGVFDISIWPLIKLWKQSEEKNVLPREDDVKEAKNIIGYQKIELLQDNQVRLLNKDMMLDLGGIAKGYALDEAARIFREYGIKNFYLDAGGDIYVGGLNCQRQLWRIGIQDPRKEGKILSVIQLSNAAVTTSGDYARYFTIQNQKFSHIVNPITGYPQKDVVSATVIAPLAKDADAFSTALSILGEKEGLALIDQQGYPYAALIVVKKDQERIKKAPSRELKKYFLYN